MMHNISNFIKGLAFTTWELSYAVLLIAMIFAIMGLISQSVTNQQTNNARAAKTVLICGLLLGLSLFGMLVTS